jgi:hypothetical protein
MPQTKVSMRAIVFSMYFSTETACEHQTRAKPPSRTRVATKMHILVDFMADGLLNGVVCIFG